MESMKRKYSFIAVLEKQKENIGVYFPSLDGCITGGNTIDEAMCNAKEVLRLHLFAMKSDGDDIFESYNMYNLNLASNETAVVIEIDL